MCTVIAPYLNGLQLIRKKWRAHMSPDHVTHHSAPTPSGSTVKPPVPPVAATDPGPIPRSALVCGSSHAESDLVRDLRSVAMGAACQWTRARSSECITGTPEEFGAICAFLCSQQAAYLTGQNVLADGGAYPGTY